MPETTLSDSDLSAVRTYSHRQESIATARDSIGHASNVLVKVLTTLAPPLAGTSSRASHPSIDDSDPPDPPPEPLRSRNPMAYFTTHHFSPHWTAQEHPDGPDAPADPAGAASGPAPAPAPPSVHSHYLPVGRLAHLIQSLHPHRKTEPTAGAEAETGVSKAATAPEPAVVYPRFDLVESPTAFVLYGELPGIGPGVGDLTVAVDDALATVSVSGLLVRTVPGGRVLRWSHNLHVAHPGAEDPGPAPEDPKGEGEEDPETAAPTTPQLITEAPADAAATLTWHAVERAVGRFLRVFHFAADEVEVRRVHAGLRYGLLTVVVPKARRAGSGGRAIAVADGAPQAPAETHSQADPTPTGQADQAGPTQQATRPETTP